MTRAIAERGAGRIGTIIGLVVFVLVIYALIIYIPTWVKINTYKDYLTDKARWLGAEEGQYEDRLKGIREDTNREWLQLGLSKVPLTEEQLKFERTTSVNRIIWRMELPIKTIFTTFKKKIDYTAEAPFI